MKIEAQGKEAILRNSHGDIAIIPIEHVQEVMGMIKDKCYSCIDKYVSGLPKASDYAIDGTIVPDDPPYTPVADNTNVKMPNVGVIENKLEGIKYSGGTLPVTEIIATKDTPEYRDDVASRYEDVLTIPYEEIHKMPIETQKEWMRSMTALRPHYETLKEFANIAASGGMAPIGILEPAIGALTGVIGKQVTKYGAKYIDNITNGLKKLDLNENILNDQIDNAIKNLPNKFEQIKLIEPDINIDNIFDKFYIPTEFEKAYRNAIIKYRKLSSSSKNLKRAAELDKKYGTNYRNIILEQYARGNSLDNIWNGKKETYLPDYASIEKPGTRTTESTEQMIPGEDYRAIVTYPDYYLNTTDVNYLSKARSRGMAVVETDEIDDIYRLVSHEDKHIKDLAANAKKVFPKTKEEYESALSDMGRQLDSYYSAYQNDMFYKLEELPEIVRNDLSLKMGTSERTYYDYLTTPTEIESHVMTNMRDDIVSKGILSDHWDNLTEEKLNTYFKESDNRYKYLVKDKKAFIDRFNEAVYGLIPISILQQTIQNNPE